MNERPNLVKENIIEFEAYLTHIAEKADATGEFRRRWKTYHTMESVTAVVAALIGLAVGILLTDGVGGRIGGGVGGLVVGAIVAAVVVNLVYYAPLKTGACFARTRSRFRELFRETVQQQPVVDLAVGAALDWREGVCGAFGMLSHEMHEGIPGYSAIRAGQHKRAIQDTLRLGTPPDHGRGQAALFVTPGEFSAHAKLDETPEHIAPAHGTKYIDGALTVMPAENLPKRYEAAQGCLLLAGVFVTLAVLNVKGMIPLWCVGAAVTGLVSVLLTCHRRFMFDRASGKIRKQTVMLGTVLAFSECPFDRYDKIRVEPYRRTEEHAGKPGASTSTTVTRFRVEMVSREGTLRLQDVISKEEDALALAEAVRMATRLPVRVDKDTLESQMEQEQHREAATSERPQRKLVGGVSCINGSLVVGPELPWYLGVLVVLPSAGVAAGFALLNFQGMAPLCWLGAAVLALAGTLMSCHHCLVFDRASRKIRKQTKVLGMVLAVSESPFGCYDEIVIDPYRHTSVRKGSSGVYRVRTYTTRTKFRVAVIGGDRALEIRNCALQEEATALAEAVQSVMCLPVRLDLDRIQAQMRRH